MSTLYISEQGAQVGKKDQRLYVTREKEVLFDIPLRKLERVYVFGNVQLTTQAMGVLLDEEIELAFFSSHGRYKGCLGGNMSKNIPLRVAQYQTWFDPGYRLQMAKRFVEAKLLNMQRLLQHYRYNHSDLDSCAALSAIKSTLKSLPEARSNESVMGLEGHCSREYFRVLAGMFRSEITFPGRQRHPAPDPINALLSLGYTLVGNEISSVLESMALDPYLGYLHNIKYGRKSLALDMLEEFRQALVDPFTLRLINLNILTENDFEETQEGVRLKPEPFKEYLRHYEDRMERNSFNWQGDKINGRRLIYNQVNELRQAIGENRCYCPHNTRE